MSSTTKASKGRLFLTGATGYIGRVIAEFAVPEGYDVHGLSRSSDSDAILKALGANPIRGDLASFDVLTRESKAADVVMHLAFIHDFSADYNKALAADYAAVDAMAEGLKGTGKPFIVSSGTALVEPDPEGRETDEEAPIWKNPSVERIKAEQYSLHLKDEGVRVVAIRLPQFVYGRGGSAFHPLLIRLAASNGESLYIEQGAVRTSDVHVDDAARMHLLAADKARPGDVFNCTGSTEITYRQLAEAIGEVLDVSVRSMTLEEAKQKWGPFMATHSNRENRASSRKAIEQLGWQPTGIDRLTDTTKGSYVAVAKELQKDPSKKIAGL